MDGGYVAMCDVATAIERAELGDAYRLIGGIAVMLHVERSGVDVPVRMTRDADYGVAPHVLRAGALVGELEKLGYHKVQGNRWERRLSETVVASTDLLVPAYTSRARDNKRVGDVVTTEVPGLADAFRHPPVVVNTEVVLSDGRQLSSTVLLPDAFSMLKLKLGARNVRHEDRDATDLWRCLEVARLDGVNPNDFAAHESGTNARTQLARELGPGGPALTSITADYQEDVAREIRTRIAALLRSVAGL
jgi:hypothetical protein